MKRHRIVDGGARETWSVATMTTWARDFLGFTASDVAMALGTSATTLRRWSGGASTPRRRHHAQLDLLLDFRALLESAFVTPERAMTWLRTPPGLGYEVSPLMMVRAGAIRPLVMVLASLESGAFR